MNILTDLEIIRSAVLFGEIDDATSRITKREAKYRFSYSISHKEKYRAAADLLSKIRNILSGDAPIESIVEFASIIGSYGFSQFEADAAMEYLSNLAYYLKITMDRYNVKLPVFDPKRCGDL